MPTLYAWVTPFLYYKHYQSFLTAEEFVIHAFFYVCITKISKKSVSFILLLGIW